MSEARDELAEWCYERLADLARRDRMAWYPVIGWIDANGKPYGLAVERFGADFTEKQQRQLGKALFKLAYDDRIEGAQCRRSSDGRGIVLPPLGYQFYAALFANTDSGGINPWNSEYVARLLPVE